jgi:hypothetical protein
MQNPATGRFTYGWNSALNVPLEGDHFLHQAGAAIALARSARFFNDSRCSVRAKQAVLSLMAETRVDANDKSIRYTTLPSLAVNRLAAAALLLLAIHELPNPADDLLQQGEELANFIRSQQRADGSIRYLDTDDPPKDTEPEILHTFPGLALHSVLASQRLRPAPWKIELARKALPYYQAWWKARPCSGFVRCQSAAFAEAYLLTKEPAFAQFVFALNDWVCSQQYSTSTARQAPWVGGFRWVPEVKTAGWEMMPPQVESAMLAEGLIAACRVTRQVPDAERFERYRTSLMGCMGFVMSLQFNDSNTLHFAPNYRSLVVGGFHTSHHDGNLRIDASQHAVCALIGYMEHVEGK